VSVECDRGAGIPCTSGELVGELARGVRMHFSHYVKQLEEHTWRDAQRGLAHSYSRAKVKFNVNRVDNMIIQVCTKAESCYSLNTLHWTVACCHCPFPGCG
jgi:RNA processing factor Prp31